MERATKKFKNAAVLSDFSGIFYMVASVYLQLLLHIFFLICDHVFYYLSVSIFECFLYSGLSHYPAVSMKACTWSITMLRYVLCVKVTSTWTQCCPAEHFSKHHTALAGLPSSHSPSSYQVFPSKTPTCTWPST